MVKYIHMQSHILRQNRRLKSHQHQIHVHASHKKYNTICTEISSLMKTYSSGQQEKLEENEKKVLLKSCLNDTTDKIASNILSIECIKRTSFTIYHKKLDKLHII